MLAVAAVGAGRFFGPSLVIVFFGCKYRENIVQHLLKAIPFSSFPIYYTERLEPAYRRGACSICESLFSPAPHTTVPYPLFLLIMVGSLETLKFSLTTNPTKRYIDCYPYLILSIVVALCLLAVIE